MLNTYEMEIIKKKALSAYASFALVLIYKERNTVFWKSSLHDIKIYYFKLMFYSKISFHEELFYILY